MSLKKRSLSLVLVLSMVFSMFGILQNTGVNAVSAYDNTLEFNFSKLREDKTFDLILACKNGSGQNLSISSVGMALKLDTSKIKPNPENTGCIAGQSGLNPVSNTWDSTRGLVEVSISNMNGVSISNGSDIDLVKITLQLVPDSSTGQTVIYNEAGLNDCLGLEQNGSDGSTQNSLGIGGNVVCIGGANVSDMQGDNITPTFNWPKLQCNVTFKDGANELTTKTVPEGTKLDTDMPSDPTAKDGYKFAGWVYKDTSTGSAVETGFTKDTVVNSDMEVTAKWTPLISFDLNGGKLATDTQIKAQEIEGSKSYQTLLTDAGVTTAPTRDFYKFEGWNTDKDATSGIDLSDTCSSTEPVTLYAIWNPIEYSVKCGCDANTSPSSCDHIKNGSKVKATDENGLNLDTISKAGFHFVGWIQKVAADATKKYVENNLLKLTGSLSDYNISGDDSSGYTIKVTPDFNVYKGTLELYLETDGTVEKVAETKDAFEYSKPYSEALESVKFASGATVDKDAFDLSKVPKRDGYTFKGFTFVNKEGNIVDNASKNIFDDVNSCVDFYAMKLNPDTNDGEENHVIRIASCWEETAANKIARIVEELNKKSSFDANDVQSFKDLVAALAKVDDTFDKSAYEKDELENRFGDRLSAAIQKDSEKLKVEGGLKWSVEVTSEESTDGKVGEVDIKGLLLADKELVKLYDVTLADILDSTNTNYKETADGKIKISMPILEGYEDKADKLFIIHYNEDTKEIEYIRPTVEDGRLYGELESFSPIGIAAQKDSSTTDGASTETESDDKAETAASKKSLKTGDQTNIGLVLVMFAVSAILLGYALVTLKKNKGNKEND